MITGCLNSACACTTIIIIIHFVFNQNTSRSVSERSQSIVPAPPRSYSIVLSCGETSGMTEERRCSITRAAGAEGAREVNSGISKTAACRGTSNAPMFDLDNNTTVLRYAAKLSVDGWMDGWGRS